MSNVRVKITQNSAGVIKTLISDAKKNNDKRIFVGVIDKKKRKNQQDEIGENVLTNAQIALYNEFGTENIPPRSFIRTTLSENSSNYYKLRAKLAKNILDGKLNQIKAMKLLGAQAASDVKKKIRDLKTPENAESTIKRKKSSNPLIDTGQMRNSVNYIIATRKEIGL